MPTFLHALIMFAAGIGVPVLGALNARLGGRIGSPAAAAVLLFLVALGCALVAMLATAPSALTRLTGHPPYLYLAGGLVAFYILSITFIAPHFGVGNAIFLALLGQIVSSALIDHFGILGVTAKPLELSRIAGIALMAGGMLLALRS